MPLNINSVGSSGVGGSETSSKSLIYQGIIEEHATGGSTYKFQDDFICSYDGTKNNDKFRNSMYYSNRDWNPVNSSNCPTHTVYINHIPYLTIGRVWTNDSSNNVPGCTSCTSSGLFKFTKQTPNSSSSTYTEITTRPPKGSYLLRNRSLVSDKYWIYISSESGSVAGTSTSYTQNAINFLANGTSYGSARIWKFDGTSWTLLTEIYTLWKNIAGKQLNSNIKYGSLYNAFRDGNKLYLIMTDPINAGTYASNNVICVEYNLDTAKVSNTYYWTGLPSVTPYNCGDTVIINDILYELHDNIESDGATSVKPTLVKYKTKFPYECTLTVITQDLLNINTYERELIVSRIQDNNYIIGAGSFVGNGYNRWQINANTLQIYVDPASGDIVENKPFKTTHNSEDQTIAFATCFTESTVRGGLFRNCVAFDYDSETRTLSFCLNVNGLNHEYLVVWYLENFNKVDVFGGGSNRLSGYFEKGDVVYSNAEITDVSGDYDIGNINQHKYTIPVSGTLQIRSQSSEYIPSFIVVDKNGNLIYFQREYNEKTHTLTMNPISGMKCNDVLIDVNTRNYTITNEKFGSRLYIDMRGV